MTCMPMFPVEKIPAKPVRWETTWVDENVISTGRTKKRKTVNQVWKEKEGTYHVITLAHVGEEAAYKGPETIRQYLETCGDQDS
jgi:hypothetical protein